MPPAICWNGLIRSSTCCAPRRKSGAIPDEEVEALISRRVEPKKARNFVEVRSHSRPTGEQGIILEDTKDGPDGKESEIPNQSGTRGHRKKRGGISHHHAIHTAVSFFYEDMETLDRVFGREEAGFN